MRLWSLPTSPYAARVLIQAHEKGLKLEVAYPGEGQTLAEHAALNPFGRVPFLETASGNIIESAAILEYIEDAHPTPSLRPVNAVTTGQMRGFILATDHYLFPVIRQLRAALKDPAELPKAMADLDSVLASLQKLMDGKAYICDAKFTLADCALVPGAFYLERFLSRLGQGSMFTHRPVWRDWWATVNGHDSVTRVLNDLELALAPKPR